jgi:hypothetical protein
MNDYYVNGSLIVADTANEAVSKWFGFHSLMWAKDFYNVTVTDKSGKLMKIN